MKKPFVSILILLLLVLLGLWRGCDNTPFLPSMNESVQTTQDSTKSKVRISPSEDTINSSISEQKLNEDNGSQSEKPAKDSSDTSTNSTQENKKAKNGKQETIITSEVSAKEKDCCSEFIDLFQRIESDSFMMGKNNPALKTNYSPEHKVILSSFYVMKRAVSVALFSRFVNETGYKTLAEKELKTWIHPGNSTSEQNYRYNSERVLAKPEDVVVNISYFDMVEFIKWMNSKCCYTTQFITEAQLEYCINTKEKYHLEFSPIEICRDYYREDFYSISAVKDPVCLKKHLFNQLSARYTSDSISRVGCEKYSRNNLLSFRLVFQKN